MLQTLWLEASVQDWMEPPRSLGMAIQAIHKHTSKTTTVLELPVHVQGFYDLYNPHEITEKCSQFFTKVSKMCSLQAAIGLLPASSHGKV